MFHLAAPKADGALGVFPSHSATSSFFSRHQPSLSPPWGYAAISQAFIIVDVLLCNRAERNDCLRVILGSRWAWFPHVSLKRSSITANQRGPLGCEGKRRRRKKTAVGLWLMANEVGKGWGYIFTLSGFVLMMWCVLSQTVIACVLIHSLGSRDFPVGRVDLRRPPFFVLRLHPEICHNF